MEFQELLDGILGLSLGWQGLVFVAIILTSVWLAKKSGLVANGNHARVANLVMAAVLAGLTENPQSEGALLAVLSSVLSALLYEGLGKVGDKLKKETA